MLLVLDIDGTLANTSKRDHFIDKPEPSPEDWESFNAIENVVQDDPFLEAQFALPDLLEEIDEIIILSGRPEYTRDITIDWLEEHYNLGLSNPKVVDVVLRPGRDFRKARKFKEGIIFDVILPEYGNEEIIFVDDDLDNIEMMSKFGEAWVAPKIWKELIRGS